mmetsp:Transcript_2236/g.7472  ORF Transcript_2236/g.7472 Transcript_2236/m.7472 type:complete len:474 (-) Transcript_2236:944-2365(-)
MERSSAGLPSSLSRRADLSQTLGPPPWDLALASRTLARSVSSFSNSSLKAASTTSSLSGLAAKASDSTALAPATSPRSHLSLAPMSHRSSLLGQYVVALARMASRTSGSPAFLFSRSAARLHRPFFAGNFDRAWWSTHLAVWTLPLLSSSSASATQVFLASSSSTPSPTVLLTSWAHVPSAGWGLCLSQSSAKASHCSRVTTAPFCFKDLTALSTILATRPHSAKTPKLVSGSSLALFSSSAPSAPLFLNKFASSSFAAATQISGSVGRVCLALFSTFLALSWVSSLASASHSSLCCGQHSVALLSSTRASSSDDRSTRARQSRTLFGRRSSAFLRTLLWAAVAWSPRPCSPETSGDSSLAASSHSLTDFGTWARPLAMHTFFSSGVCCSSEAWSQMSSDLGQAAHPLAMRALAFWAFPRSDSSLAAAIQPGAWLGFVAVTDCSSFLAFFTSWMSFCWKEPNPPADDDCSDVR